MTAIPVVTVGGPDDGLVEGLERLHGPVTVVRRCAELTELLAACQSGLAMAAVVGTGAGELTATLVDRLASVGVAVVALTDDGGEAARLRAMGAVVAPSMTAADDLAGCISGAVAGRSTGRPEAAATAPFRAEQDWMDSTANPPDQGSPTGQGKIIAVWGPAGAPGRTTVAANLAAEFGAVGHTVVLVDADTYAASQSATLGLLDESAGLAQACRLADQGILDAGALGKIVSEVLFSGGRLRLLSGLTRADRWPELRSAALQRVLQCCRASADITVIDCGFCLEADEELSYDTVAPRRNAATLCSIEAADQVLAVGAGDPLGIPRLIRALAELEAVAPGAETTVVVNKVRMSAAGRNPQAALQDAWSRFGPAAPIGHYLPWAPEILDKAQLAGALLIETAPQHPLRQELAALAGELCAPGQRSRRSAVRSTRAKPLASR